MRIIKLNRKTAGGNHGWYETDKGFEIRKPLGVIDAGISVMVHSAPIASESSGTSEAKGGSIPHPAQKSWWQRFVQWITKLWK